MDEETLLRNISKWQGPRRRKRVGSIGPVVDAYIKRELWGAKRRAVVVDMWDELVPESLAGHCRLAGIGRGQLQIEVESGSYMFQMQAFSSQLLERLRQRCPGAGIEKIKLKTMRYKRENQIKT